jgi:hypothetical protein
VKRLIVLLALGLALSACTVRVDLGVGVNEDESGTFSMFVGLDEEFQQLAQSGGEDLNFTQALEDVPEGWTAEEVSQDGFDGVKISTDFTSFDDLQAKLSQLSAENGGGGFGTDFFSNFGLTHEGDEFRFKVEVSGLSEGLGEALGGAGGGEDMLQGFSPDEIMQELFEIRFLLTLPGEIVSNNADSVDGNTLIWNVAMSDEGTTYEAVSTTSGGGAGVLWGVLALVVVAAAALAFILYRKKQERDAVAAVTGQPVMGSTPPEEAPGEDASPIRE